MPGVSTGTEESLDLRVGDGLQVGARFLRPHGATACYVFAHGAGAGMDHPFMQAAALELAQLHIATLRFQFPYMQRGSRRTDPPPLCHTTVRAAVAQAALRAPDLPLFAGGRSFGGRMTSQAQAVQALPGVRGLVFLGFPLHPAGSPSDTRAAHLLQVQVPMLFVQGTADALAERTLLTPLVERLRPRADVLWVQDADHSFHVPARSGRKDDQVLRELLAGMAAWVKAHS